MLRHRQYLLAGASFFGWASIISTSAAAQTRVPDDTIPAIAGTASDTPPGDIIVTAQRRSESINHVPVAVTAIDSSTMKRDQIDSGADIQRAVPNFSFSRASFGSTNYQIRGVGYQVVSTAADTGVSIEENDVPLIVNRLADADFFDMERVEVLRGPQGTLYGRNATGGVVNLITAKPVDRFDAAASIELGNYSDIKLDGHVNVPLTSTLNLRVAGTRLSRDGYIHNAELDDRIDGRNLYSTRVSLAFHPSAGVTANFMWERFDEDDDRFGGNKFVCAKDNGPAAIGGVAVTNPDARNYLSRGCLQTSVYDRAAQTGTVNSFATLTGRLAALYGLVNGDANAGAVQAGGARSLNAAIDPTYRALNNLFEFNLRVNLSDTLQVSSLTSYSTDHLRTRARFQDGSVPFNETPVTPGGVFDDPQTGPSRFLNLDEDYDNYDTRQWTEEVRLQSSSSGPINFSAGALYLHLDRLDNVYILSNGGTGATVIGNLLGGDAYVDPNMPPDGTGHNYYYSRQPYTLESLAAFGEFYWNLTPRLRLTLGGRLTQDRKDFKAYPIELLAPGRGFPDGYTNQRATFREPTGRATLDWLPRLSFTDSTLIYGSVSRGYKGGGFNVPNIVDTRATYDPEFVTAFEIGTKNSLFNNRLQVALTGFYYDYSNYQISQVAGLSEFTANINARIKGVEFESNWAVTRRLRISANLGYLDARIRGGQSINPFDRTNGDPDYTYLKSLTSGCMARTADIAALIGQIDAGTVPAGILGNLCPTDAAPQGAYASSDPAVNPLAALGITVPTSAGVPVQLDGKHMPYAPDYTVTLGADYTLPLPHGWQAVLHGDFYRQGASYADIYNDPANRLRGWSNVNLTLTFIRPSQDINVRFFVKNLLDAAPITGIGVDAESLGLSRSVVYLDPRRYGVALTKRFR